MPSTKFETGEGGRGREEALNLKHEIRKEEVSGQWSTVIGVEEEVLAQSRGGAGKKSLMLMVICYWGRKRRGHRSMVSGHWGIERRSDFS